MTAPKTIRAIGYVWSLAVMSAVFVIRRASDPIRATIRQLNPIDGTNHAYWISVAFRCRRGAERSSSFARRIRNREICNPDRCARKLHRYEKSRPRDAGRCGRNHRPAFPFRHAFIHCAPDPSFVSAVAI